MDCLCADLELPFCPAHPGDENHVGIKRLRAALAEHKRALAAGPAALQEEANRMITKGNAPGGAVGECAHALRLGIALVKAAQERALKGGG